MYYQRRPMQGRPGPRPFMPQRPMMGMRGMPYPPRRPAPFVPRGPPRPGPMGRVPPYGSAQPPRFPQGVGEIFLPFLQVDRKLPELCRRYPKLFFSPDLIRVVSHWVDIHDNLEIPLLGNTGLRVDAEQALAIPDSYAKDPDANDEGLSTDRYFTRVILISPKPDDPVVEEPKVETPQAPTAVKLPTHPWQKIRFVLAINHKGHRVPYGGEWIAEDGEDPTAEATLINTATRLCKEQSGLDLSSVTKWYKIVETQYRRKNGGVDHSIIMVPDIWTNEFNGDVLKGVAKEEKEVDQEVEEEVQEEQDGEMKTVTKKVVKKVTQTADKIVFTPIETSLQTLIEQNTHETGESTVETSLFAAAIDELVGFRYAKKLLETLRKKKKEADEAATTLKRKREEEASERELQQKKAIEEMEAKRRKLQEENAAKEAWKTSRLEEEKNMSDEEIQKRRQEETEKEEEERKTREEEAKRKRDEDQAKREEDAKRKVEEAEEQRKKQEEEDRARGYSIVKTTHNLVDEDMALPFQFFDRPSYNTPGQLRRDTLEGVLHALGELTQREVEGLLKGVGLPPDRPTGPLFYRRLAGYTVVEEKQVPIVSDGTTETPAETPAPTEGQAETQA